MKNIAVSETETEIEEARQESEENFRILADSISQFAWMADANGSLFWYNQRWFEYTGTTLEEMQGWGWQTVHHPKELDRVVEKFQQCITAGEAWEDIFPLRSKDGEYRWFLSRALPIRNEQGKIVRWFGTNTDIEDVRRAEEKLKEADRRKDEFLATLAHELRNPLAPIRSGLEVIRRTGADHSKFTETLDILERQTNQIVHLVDDLLDISRISQGKIKLRKERIELKVAIEIALETSQGLINEAENELTITLPDEPIFLDADVTRIAQIFLNILNNAAKYSSPGGKISVIGSKEGGEALIIIRDSGFGIAPEMISKIFDMFGQVETSEEQARGGLGIGLSVVRKMVELHGGTVEVFSNGIGEGSEFSVRLPLAAEQSETIPASQISETDIIQTAQMDMPHDDDKSNYQATPEHRILVVDDNQDAAEMLEALLTLEGHTVRISLDGTKGIETAEEFKPAICLCDIGLPGMNGYELAVRLREMFPNALLISVSGWGREEDRQQSKKAGFNYHLVKPVQFDDLLKLIKV